MADVPTLTEFQVAVLDRLANSNSTQLAVIEAHPQDPADDMTRKVQKMADMRFLEAIDMVTDISTTFVDGINKCRSENNGRGYVVFQITDNAMIMFNDAANRTVQ